MKILVKVAVAALALAIATTPTIANNGDWTGGGGGKQCDKPHDHGPKGPGGHHPGGKPPKPETPVEPPKPPVKPEPTPTPNPPVEPPKPPVVDPKPETPAVTQSSSDGGAPVVSGPTPCEAAGFFPALRFAKGKTPAGMNWLGDVTIVDINGNAHVFECVRSY